MARARTGQLIWRKSGWYARFTAEVEGEKLRVCRALGTTNRAVARRKLARLVEGETAPSQAQQKDTFEQVCGPIMAELARTGIKSAPDRLTRLRTYAFPLFGTKPIDQVTDSDVTDALEHCRDQGLSEQTMIHLKNDISAVFRVLLKEKQVERNVALGVSIPAGGGYDDRERAQLTDDEFNRFMACRDVDPELHTMAMVSRCFGGMRESDLHAWRWEHIDLVNWSDAHVPRPKTDKRSRKRPPRLALPEQLLPILQVWWDRHGAPLTGPVFPSRRGPRAGEHKLKSSYAKALRAALLLAGVDRAELHTATDFTRPVDFHSFRRAYATGLARAGVNAQQAMALAGHTSYATHRRYIGMSESLAVPDAALPGVSAPRVPFASEADRESEGFSSGLSHIRPGNSLMHQPALTAPRLPVSGQKPRAQEVREQVEG